MRVAQSLADQRLQKAYGAGSSGPERRRQRRRSRRPATAGCVQDLLQAPEADLVDVVRPATAAPRPPKPFLATGVGSTSRPDSAQALYPTINSAWASGVWDVTERLARGDVSAIQDPGTIQQPPPPQPQQQQQQPPPPPQQQQRVARPATAPPVSLRATGVAFARSSHSSSDDRSGRSQPAASCDYWAQEEADKEREGRELERAERNRELFIEAARSMSGIRGLEVLTNLLEGGQADIPPVDVDTQGFHGQTALANAVGAGYIEGARLLLRYGANVNLANRRGWTPLMLAAKAGQLPLTKLLLRAQADIERQTDGNKETALTLAISHSLHYTEPQTVKERLLANGGAGQHALVAAELVSAGAELPLLYGEQGNSAEARQRAGELAHAGMVLGARFGATVLTRACMMLKDVLANKRNNRRPQQSSKHQQKEHGGSGGGGVGGRAGTGAQAGAGYRIGGNRAANTAKILRQQQKLESERRESDNGTEDEQEEDCASVSSSSLSSLEDEDYDKAAEDDAQYFARTGRRREVYYWPGHRLMKGMEKRRTATRELGERIVRARKGLHNVEFRVGDQVVVIGARKSGGEVVAINFQECRVRVMDHKNGRLAWHDEDKLRMLIPEPEHEPEERVPTEAELYAVQDDVLSTSDSSPSELPGDGDAAGEIIPAFGQRVLADDQEQAQPWACAWCDTTETSIKRTGPPAKTGDPSADADVTRRRHAQRQLLLLDDQSSNTRLCMDCGFKYALGLQLEDPPPPCTLPPTADIDGNDVDGNEVLRLERTSYAGGATGYVVSARYAADRAAEKEYNQQMNLKESERAKRAWAEKRKLRRLNLKGQQAQRLLTAEFVRNKGSLPAYGEAMERLMMETRCSEHEIREWFIQTRRQQKAREAAVRWTGASTTAQASTTPTTASRVLKPGDKVVSARSGNKLRSRSSGSNGGGTTDTAQVLANRVLAAEQEARDRQVQRARLLKAQREEKDAELKTWGGELSTAKETEQLRRQADREEQETSTSRISAAEEAMMAMILSGERHRLSNSNAKARPASAAMAAARARTRGQEQKRRQAAEAVQRAATEKVKEAEARLARKNNLEEQLLSPTAKQKAKKKEEWRRRESPGKSSSVSPMTKDQVIKHEPEEEKALTAAQAIVQRRRELQEQEEAQVLEDKADEERKRLEHQSLSVALQYQRVTVAHKSKGRRGAHADINVAAAAAATAAAQKSGEDTLVEHSGVVGSGAAGLKGALAVARSYPEEKFDHVFRTQLLNASKEMASREYERRQLLREKIEHSGGRELPRWKRAHIGLGGTGGHQTTGHVSTWSSTAVGRWLRRLGVSKASVARFRARNVDGRRLAWLSEDGFVRLLEGGASTEGDQSAHDPGEGLKLHSAVRKSAVLALYFVQSGYDEEKMALMQATTKTRLDQSDEYSEFHVALIVGDLDVVRDWLSSGRADPNQLTGKGYSPLSLAVGSGRPLIVRALLEAGATDERYLKPRAS